MLDEGADDETKRGILWVAPVRRSLRGSSGLLDAQRPPGVDEGDSPLPAIVQVSARDSRDPSNMEDAVQEVCRQYRCTPYTFEDYRHAQSYASGNCAQSDECRKCFMCILWRHYQSE